MWARDHGGEVITVLLDNDAMHLRARCPECQCQVRVFYTHQGKTACRKCQNLGSPKRFQSRAQRRARQPDAVKFATKAANNFLKTDDQKQLSAAMTILNNVPQSEFDDLDDVQKYIVRDDIARLSKLMTHVENQIYSNVENHCDRRGDSSTIPLRADSLAKLGNLFISASTARAARSGIADKLRIETRTTEGIGGKPMKDILRDEMIASGWKMQNGMTYDEFENAWDEQQAARALPEVAEGEVLKKCAEK